MSTEPPILWPKYPFRHYPDALGSFDPAALPHRIPIPTHQATPADVERVERLGLDPRRPEWEQLRGLLLRQGLRAGDLETLTVGAILATLSVDPPTAAPNPAAPPADGRPLPPARHSPDFRSVHWFGTDYTFTEAQAAVVAVLWEAWENGTPDVGHRHLLATAKLDSDRLPDVFKVKGQHVPAWGTMIRSNVGSKGTVRLCSPAP